MASKIFYQSSLPRAGSTLLQNILAQNPDFYVTPTSGLLELVFGARLNYTNSAEFKAQDGEAMKKAFLAFSRAGMTAYFEALTDRPYAVDKSRGWGVHFDLLQMIFGEEPKIVCMVRDLRQILSSMEKKFRQNPDKYRAIENHANLTGTTTLKRTILNLQSAPVGLALDRLQEVHQRGWAKKMLFVRFEDLTTQPGAVMKKIYGYLGVPDFATSSTRSRRLPRKTTPFSASPACTKSGLRWNPYPAIILMFWDAMPCVTCSNSTAGISNFLGTRSEPTDRI